MSFIRLCIYVGTATILFCVGCGPKRGETKPALSLKALYALLDNHYARSQKVSAFWGQGYFSYVDKRQELNLLMRVRHDRAARFTRITFYGTLDNNLWGDVVAYRDRVSLYFPIQKRLYVGSYSNFDLYPFTRIHIQLFELLKLMQGRTYFIDNFQKRKGYYSNQFYKLVLANSSRWQLLYLDKKDGQILYSRVYAGKKEQARLRYQYYKMVEGIKLAAKTTLKVAKRSLKAVIWYRKMGRNYTFSAGDEKVKIGKDIEIVRM